LQFFILFMIEHPDVQAKAREEIDRVVGSDRLPILDDMPNLPYVTAIIQEIHRTRPISPLAVPHRAMEDIMYRRYRIPAGSSVIGNIWGVYHDPNLFDDPDTFNPDRFLGSRLGFKKDAAEALQNEDMFRRFNVYPFGFGRRVCPGIHLATNSISLNVTRMLWGFEFVAAFKCSKDGTATTEPASSWDFTPGLSLDPLPFKSTIRTRTPRHAEIIEQAFFESTSTFERFERELSEGERTFVEDQRSHWARAV